MTMRASDAGVAISTSYNPRVDLSTLWVGLNVLLSTILIISLMFEFRLHGLNGFLNHLYSGCAVSFHFAYDNATAAANRELPIFQPSLTHMFLFIVTAGLILGEVTAHLVCSLLP